MAKHAYQFALAQYRQTIIVAFGQVADALTGLSHSDESVTMLQQAADTDSVILDLACNRIRPAPARLDLVRTQNRRYLDLMRLFVALGGSPY